MSSRYALRLYKGAPEDSFRAAASTTASRLGGELIFGQQGQEKSAFRIGRSGDISSIYVPYQDRAYEYCRELGGELAATWMELRIQEDALWDYSLYVGRENVSKFSTWSQYWVPPDEHVAAVREWSGDAEMLSRLWAVPLERIERYIVNWGWISDEDEETIGTELKGKAYPTDEFEYGDCLQFWDFLGSIGAVDATEEHRLILPHVQKRP